MARHGIARAEENRRIRQEGLRQFLSNQKLIEKVIDSARELEALEQDEAWKANQLRASSDIRLRLISKFLPDLKATEHTDNSITSLSTLLQQVAQMSRDATTAQLEHKEKDVTPADSDSKAV